MVLMRAFTKILRSGKLLAVAFAVGFVFWGCNSKDEPVGPIGFDDFITRNEIGFVGYGGFLFKYSNSDCQLSINAARRQMRMQNDAQSYYVHMSFSAYPVSNLQSVDVVLTCKLGNEEIKVPSHMDVANVSADKVWLWDSIREIGLIIPVFEE